MKRKKVLCLFDQNKFVVKLHVNCNDTVYVEQKLFYLKKIKYEKIWNQKYWHFSFFQPILDSIGIICNINIMINAPLLENCFVFFFCSIEELSVSFTLFALNNHVWMLTNFVPSFSSTIRNK